MKALKLGLIAAVTLASVAVLFKANDPQDAETAEDRYTFVTFSPLVVQNILDLVNAATSGGVLPTVHDADGFTSGDICFLAVALRTAAGTGDPADLDPDGTGAFCGNVPVGEITAEEFALIDALDANQVSEDGEVCDRPFAGVCPNYTDGLFVLVFDNDPQGEPLNIEASSGTIWTSPLDIPAEQQEQILCDTEEEDPDCIPGSLTQDGIVAFAFTGPLDNRGDVTITVTNELDNDEGVLTLTGVGDPVEVVGLLNLDPRLEVGGTEVCRPDPDNEPFTFAELLQITTLAGLPDAGLVAVQVKDSDGTGLTGVPVEWNSEDEDIVIPGFENQYSLFNSGLLLGPNLMCSGSETGTGNVEVVVKRAAGGNRSVSQKRTTLSWTVIGKPAQFVAFADPPTIDCDGINTTTVSYYMLDRSANASVGGHDVSFDVQVLGTANPIAGTTNADGLATSLITPLAQEGTTGVPVIITSELGQTSVSVNCQVGAGAGVPGSGTPPPPSGGAGAGGQQPGGSISGPDTGSGGVAGRGTLPVWPAVALFVAAMGLAGARFGLRRL